MVVNFLIATLIGFMGGLGLLMTLQGVRGNKVLPDRSDFESDAEVGFGESFSWFVGACLTGVAMYLITGWIVLAAATVGAISFLPRVLAERNHKEDLDRTRAIACLLYTSDAADE